MVTQHPRIWGAESGGRNRAQVTASNLCNAQIPTLSTRKREPRTTLRAPAVRNLILDLCSLICPASGHRPRFRFPVVHSVEYDPFIKRQHASTRINVGPHQVQISSRPLPNLGVPEPSYSRVARPRNICRSHHLDPLGFTFSHHGPTTRRSVERTAEKAFMLSDRV